MKTHRDLFRGAERLKPSPGLWRRIADEVEMPAAYPEASLPRAPMRFGGRLPMRAAAAIALAAALAGALWLAQKRPTQPASPSTAAQESLAAAPDAGEYFDSELLAWHEGLGEMDWETEEGFPFSEGESL